MLNILSSIGSKITAGIVAIGMVISGFFGINPPQEAPENLGTTVPTVVALFETTLAAAITSTATSMTLTSGTTEDSTTLSGTYGFVIDEGTTKEEFVLASCTNTACTSMTRGVSAITGNTTITALKSSHAIGATVKISDHPQLAIISRIVNGDETFPNLLSYVSSSVTPLVDNDIPTKMYVDNVAIAGASDASTTVKGIVEEATDAELQAGTAAGGTGARLFAGGASFTETPTASKVCVANDSGVLADGWLGLTTAGDTLYSDGTDLKRLALGTNTYFLQAGASAPAWGGANLNEANTFFGATDLSGSEAEDLSDGGATTLHSHTISSQLGSWAEATSDGSAILLTADSFIVCLTSGANQQATIYTDSSNPPTTIRGLVDNNASGDDDSTMVPAKKGDYYKITKTSTPTCYIIPLGN